MPQLIKNIQGNVQPYMVGNVFYNTNIYGNIQSEDFVNLTNYVGYFQNLTKTEFTSALIIPINVGIINKNITKDITLQINY